MIKLPIKLHNNKEFKEVDFDMKLSGIATEENFVVIPLSCLPILKLAGIDFKIDLKHELLEAHIDNFDIKISKFLYLFNNFNIAKLVKIFNRIDTSEISKHETIYTKFGHLINKLDINLNLLSIPTHPMSFGYFRNMTIEKNSNDIFTLIIWSGTAYTLKKSGEFLELSTLKKVLTNYKSD